jgi:hypothetical protein
MSTNFPTSLDSLTNPTGTDPLSSPSHSAQHANANDAIEAIEAKVGIAASTPTSGKVLKGSGTGSSTWDDVGTLVAPVIIGPILTPTTLDANTNNWQPANMATAFILRTFASTPINLTGLAAGVAGRLLILLNASANTITLKHASGSSGAGNQFLLPNGADLVLGTWESAWLTYDATDGYWLVMGAA